MPERPERTEPRPIEGAHDRVTEPPRRAVLAAGIGAAVGLAGCSGGGDEERSLESHPAATNLSDQPTLGPDPLDADATVIAFEDPSCTRCRAFEQETVPKIESELTDPGRGAFVFRGYPVVYDWGEPATKALEAVFDRNVDAFWALKDHYYAAQGSFGDGNVLARTESFLADETTLDAPAVIEDVEDGAYDAAVQADLDAARDADLGRTTPTVLLFKDGTYRTRAQGSVSFSLIESTLDL